MLRSSYFLLENDRAEQGWALVSFLPQSLTKLQKFRAYVLDSDSSLDILGYLLCYGLEIKDKPGTPGL